MSENGGREYLTAGEAAHYLADKWGIKSYSTTAFRMLRKRWELKPDRLVGNMSLWKPETLDKIPKPDKSKPRPSRRKKIERHEDHSEEAA